jgi:hypothetical protein
MTVNSADVVVVACSVLAAFEVLRQTYVHLKGKKH